MLRIYEEQEALRMKMRTLGWSFETLGAEEGGDSSWVFLPYTSRQRRWLKRVGLGFWGHRLRGQGRD